MGRVGHMLVVWHRQTNERTSLFKECITWWEEIRTLQKEVDQTEDKRASGVRVGKGRKGFGYRVRGGPGPGNTTVRELLPDERYAGAVLNFLRAMRVGMVKEGVIMR